jgi:probable F420-dependent oxidoreductase
MEAGMSPRPFRFAVQTARVVSGDDWAQKARRIEELGFSTLFMPDHFDNQLAPMPALAAAAAATSALRVGGLVFDNDYRHPLVFAKEMATLDVLSGGRVEVGIGAGWMRSDYDAAGIEYESPGVRIGRLKEALAIIKGLFGDSPVDFRGQHYTITNHQGLPRPVQKPHPPILLGGGGRRVLRLAAREADIVGVNFNLEPGAVNRDVMQTGDAASTDEKIGWIRDAAGDRFDDLELNVTVFVAVVTDDRGGTVERIAPGFGMSAAEVLQSPHALIGSVGQIVETLQERRERYGFSYIAFSGDGYEALAPVVKQLAGT